MTDRKPHTLLLRPTPEAIASGIFDVDAYGGRCPTMFWSGRLWEGPGCTVAGVKAHLMAIVLAGDGGALPLGCAAAGVFVPSVEAVLAGRYEVADLAHALRHLGELVALDEDGAVIE